MKTASKIMLAIIAITIFSAAEAHQPRIVFDKQNSDENTIITDPETSKAYYGELKGREDHYMITSEKWFTLYINILTPYNLEGSREDFNVEVRDFENRQVMLLKGEDHKWVLYFEKFAGDYYMKGPEAGKEIKGGIYYMNVSSKDNRGKYALAVGEKESFPLNEILPAYYTIPRLKTEFFNQPWYTSYLNYAGIAMATTLAVVITAATILIRTLRKKKSKIPIKKLF